MELPPLAILTPHEGLLSSTLGVPPVTPSTPILTDPVLLSHWYHLQLQRMQTEHITLGLPSYLSQGKLFLLP